MTSGEQQTQERVETGLLAGLSALGLRSLKWDQRMSEATQAANHRALYDEKPPTVEDDMNIVLGNVTSTTTQQQPPSRFGTIAQAAIGAGLIASGAGLAVGGPLVLDALRDLKGDTVIQREAGPRYLLELGAPVNE